MRIIDAQLHDPAPWFDWTGHDIATRHAFLTELSMGYLDALGVDGVVLFPTDLKWAASAAAALPDRVAYVAEITPDVPDAEAAVAAAKARRGTGQLAVRAVIGWPLDGSEIGRLEAGAWDPVFAACEAQQVPLFCFISGWLDHAAPIAQRYPGLTLIVDHVGLREPPLDDADDPPFAALPELLDLARFPTVFVKLCGLPSLSRQSYPYDDVAPHLRSIVDAFGADRLMWASDTTRFTGRIGLARYENERALAGYPGKHTYAEALHFILHSDVLSADEKEDILGGTVRRVFGWPDEG